MDATGWYFIAGGILQFFGIIGVGAPDIVPYKNRLSSWLRKLTRPLLRRLGRAIGRSEPTMHAVEFGGSVSTKAGASVIVGHDPNAPLQEQVEFLLGRDQCTQKKLNEHDARTRAIEEELPTLLDELRVEMREYVKTAIADAETKYRPLKALGAILLVVGLVFTTYASV
jgi:hypothetical protein